MTLLNDGGDAPEEPKPGKWASRMPPGCIVKPTLISIVALSGGIFLITRADRVGGAGRAAAVALIFIGAVLSIPILMILLGVAARWYFHRRLSESMESLKEVLDPARESVDRNKLLFGERQEYRDATEADFAALDRDWYESATRELEASGHRRLGDVVNYTIERAAGVTPVIRRMISADGTTMPCLFNLVLPPARGRPAAKIFRTVDLETEFSDGSFLITSNTAETDLTTPPPLIHRQRFPADTPLSEMLRSHEAEKATLLGSKPGAECTRVSTAEESMEFQHRQQLIKAAFQKGMGYVDIEMIRRVAKEKMPEDETAQALTVAAAAIVRRETLEKENPG